MQKGEIQTGSLTIEIKEDLSEKVNKAKNGDVFAIYTDPYYFRQKSGNGIEISNQYEENKSNRHVPSSLFKILKKHQFCWGKKIIIIKNYYFYFNKKRTFHGKINIEGDKFYLSTIFKKIFLCKIKWEKFWILPCGLIVLDELDRFWLIVCKN